MDAGNQRSRLQAGDEKHEPFSQVNQEIPEKNALQPRRGTDQLQTIPADVEPGGNGGEHAGATEMLWRPISRERREDRQHDLDTWILCPAAQSQHEPTYTETPENLAANDGDKHAGGMGERSGADADGGHREAIENECTGVVCQALALQYHQEPSG